MGHRADEGLGAADGGVGEEQSSPRFSLLCKEHGNGCTIPRHCAGQLFSCASWGSVAQVHYCPCGPGPRASTGKTSESPGLPGEVQMAGMHIAYLQAFNMGG